MLQVGYFKKSFRRDSLKQACDAHGVKKIENQFFNLEGLREVPTRQKAEIQFDLKNKKPRFHSGSMLLLPR